MSTRAPKNTNPGVTGVTVDGGTINAVPSAEASVRPVISVGAQESYTSLNTDGASITNQESVTVRWFLSRGTFQSSRSDLSDLLGFSPPTDSSSNPSFFVVVVRDDRGGVSFVGVPTL